MEVSFPYLIIYLENYIGVTKTEFSIIGGAVMVGSAVLAIPFGILADRWNKRSMIAIATVISSLGGILLSLVNSLPLLALTGFLWQAFCGGRFHCIGCLAQRPAAGTEPRQVPRHPHDLLDRHPHGDWSRGSDPSLIRNFGIPTMLNGQAGFIPVPIIFQVGSLIALLALIPLFFIRRRKQI